MNQPFAGLKVHHRGSPLAQAERVVVLFHGYGAPGDDLVSLASVWESQGTAFLFPEAPMALPQGGRAWFSRDRSDFEKGYQRALAFLLSVGKQVPELPLVVGGFSQGAMLTINLLSQAPTQLEAALIFSPAPLLPHEPSPDSPRVPLLISHGSRDQVLPFSGGQEVRDRFVAWGYPVTWVPFVGPHTIGQETVAESRALLNSLAQKP